MVNKLDEKTLNYKCLGKELRVIRKQVGVSIGQLSVKVGLSKSFISEVEREKKLPRLDTLKRIGRALNISITLKF